MTSKLGKNNLYIDNYNNDFLIVKSSDIGALKAVGRSIYEQEFDFVSEVIVTEVEVCIQLNSKFKAEHINQIKALKVSEKGEKKVYHLPVCFEGDEDWKFIEQYLSKTKKQVVEKILSTTFSISMFGFLPGFMYLSGLKEEFHVPRKQNPSKYVKQNSIAMGGKYLGLYAIDSPGGWHVIGKTPIKILNLEGLPPIPLNLDDEVKLVEINLDEYDRMLKDRLSFQDFNKDQ